jgi:hypothetical protein
MFLTGDKNIDSDILNRLSDQDLVNACQVNKKADSICTDDSFWLNRILVKFPYLSLDLLHKYKQSRSINSSYWDIFTNMFKPLRSWANYYIQDLSKITEENANQMLLKGVINNRLDIVMIAVNKGADVNNTQALLIAENKKYSDIEDYLISQGANTEYKTYANIVKYMIVNPGIEYI